jgi:hypothetical protein
MTTTILRMMMMMAMMTVRWWKSGTWLLGRGIVAASPDSRAQGDEK